LVEAESAIKSAKCSGYWHNQAALLHVQLKQYKEAEREFRGAVKCEPKVPYYQYTLALHLKDHGSSREATRSMTVALALDPQNPSMRLAMGDFLRDAGKVSAALKEYQAGLSALETVPRDSSGRNYVDASGAFYTLDGLGDLLRKRIRVTEGSQRKPAK
jgi:predicted Zn-dependent protease